jgi:hypothetical protein
MFKYWRYCANNMVAIKIINYFLRCWFNWVYQYFFRCLLNYVLILLVWSSFVENLVTIWGFNFLNRKFDLIWSSKMQHVVWSIFLTTVLKVRNLKGSLIECYWIYSQILQKTQFKKLHKIYAKSNIMIVIISTIAYLL